MRSFLQRGSRWRAALRIPIASHYSPLDASENAQQELPSDAKVRFCIRETHEIHYAVRGLVIRQRHDDGYGRCSVSTNAFVVTATHTAVPFNAVPTLHVVGLRPA